MISARFEDLCQAFRIFAEQKIRFQELFLIDAPEAIGNLEISIKAKLDTFHSLYDAVKSDSEIEFDFYQHPLCNFVLQYRNAKHHNHANGIRSVYKFAQSQPEIDPYLLVDFPAGAGEEGGSFIDHYVSWHDIFSFLDNPDDKYKMAAFELIRPRISADRIEGFALHEGYSHMQVFVNVIPIIVGAASECINALEPCIEPKSIEAKAFLKHFKNVATANFEEPEFLELTRKVFSAKKDIL